MLQLLYPEVTAAFALYFSALSIKILDDWQDREIDKLNGKFNCICCWGNAVLIYAQLLLALGSMIVLSWSLPFFFAAYCLGMIRQYQVVYLSGLKGWQEIGIVLFISIVFLGIESMSFALLMVITIQLLDDMIDFNEDKKNWSKNWAVFLGKYESLFVFLVMNLILFLIYGDHTLIVYFSFIGYELTWNLIRMKGEKGLWN